MGSYYDGEKAPDRIAPMTSVYLSNDSGIILFPGTQQSL